MINVGKVFIPRNIRDHWLWDDDRKYKRWSDLIMEAAYTRTRFHFGNAKGWLERGQQVTSVRTLMHRWKTSSRYVTDFLADLESENLITVETLTTHTIITIVNYGIYQGDQASDESAPAEIQIVERFGKRDSQHEGSQFKEDNNINNNNTSSYSTREKNLKFFEDLKNNENEIEDLAKLLECEAERIRTMMEKFIIEVVDEEHKSAGKFRTHFINWSRKHLEIQDSKNNGNGKQKPESSAGGVSNDRYASRRGTDAKDHKAEDYDGTF